MEKIINLLFPRRCAFCGEVTASKTGICENCNKEIPIILSPKCKRCGCAEDKCICTPIINHYDRIIAPFYYDGIVKTMITQIKRYSSDDSAKIAAAFIAEECRRSCKIKFDAVTAVPTDIIGYIKRGYNPAEYLARMLAEELSLPYVNFLKKRFTLTSQKNSDRLGRLENICDAYSLTGDVQDMNILLVDDVKTTGATLNECSRVLKTGRARKIYATTVCLRGR